MYTNSIRQNIENCYDDKEICFAAHTCNKGQRLNRIHTLVYELLKWLIWVIIVSVPFLRITESDNVVLDVQFVISWYLTRRLLSKTVIGDVLSIALIIWLTSQHLNHLRREELLRKLHKRCMCITSKDQRLALSINSCIIVLCARNHLWTHSLVLTGDTTFIRKVF